MMLPATPYRLTTTHKWPPKNIATANLLPTTQSTGSASANSGTMALQCAHW